MLKETFETVDRDGQPITLAIESPSAHVKNQARYAYARAWNDALKQGTMLIAKLDSYLREQELWDDAREAEYERLVAALRDGETRLRGGNIKLGEAKTIALKMAADRAALAELVSVRNEIEANCAEKLAESHQFNFLVAHCTVYDDSGKPYFTKDGLNPSVDDYVERGTEDAAFAAASKLAEMMYGTDADVLGKLPENVFLKTYGFVNDKYQLVDKRGRLVDEAGRLIDANGRYINEAGEFVNARGDRVDEAGRVIVEFRPFLDDDTGLPIGEEAPEAPTPIEAAGEPEEGASPAPVPSED
jgi:hypothetical protein